MKMEDNLVHASQASSAVAAEPERLHERTIQIDGKKTVKLAIFDQRR